MMESIEFMASLVLCLVYMALPVAAIGGVCYLFGDRRKQKA